MAEEARLDINGVFDADLTIFYFNNPDYVYNPNNIELYAKTLCFYHHPDIIHIDTVKGLEFLLLN